MITNKTALRSAIVAATLVPSLSMASGYKLNEQSAGGMGTAHAGRAAMAEDASVVFYNPAAMSFLDSAKLTVGATYIEGDGKFEGDATNSSGAVPITGADDADYYSNGGDFLGSSFIPFAYYANPINEKVAVGLGVFVPFGTSTDYNETFVGGGFADETSLKSIEIQPTISYKIDENLSIGGGIDIVYMDGLLSKYVDSVPYIPTYVGTEYADTQYAKFEGHYEVSGDDWGVGWNFGLFYKLSEETTLGFAYRSEVEFELRGDSTFENNELAVIVDNGANPTSPTPLDPSDDVVVVQEVRPQASKVPLTSPQSATFSVAHQASEQLLLQAGATWTGWSSFEYFDVIATENIADPNDPTGGMADGNLDISDISARNGLGDGYIGHIVEKWEDVWAVAIGGTYQLNDKLALRAGYAYDQSPVTDEYRTARVPSSDRQWLTFGAGYKIDQNLSVDVAAGYLFMNAMDLEETNKDLNDETIETSAGVVKVEGEYEIDVFGLSAQVNYSF